MTRQLKWFPLVLMLCGPVSIALAETLPMRSANDAHVQSVIYNPDQVVVIKTRVGVATLIQFDKREWIDPSSLVGMGDADAWKLSTKRNNILFKPTATHPDTNLTVVTDKRTYLFRLVTAKKREPAAYSLRFIYPTILATGSGKIEPCTTGPRNTNYLKWGDSALAPSTAWDDGTFTCFRFPNNTDLPEVFRKMPDGSEALANTHMEGDVMVVHDISDEFRFRFGNRVLGIRTPALKPAPYNSKGTTTRAPESISDV